MIRLILAVSLLFVGKYAIIECSINTRSPGENVNLIPLFILSLLGIPVPYERIFGHELPEGKFGKELEGDPKMPPTSNPKWPAWLNVIRNAVLAMFWWRTYSVLDTFGPISDGVYMMYGDGNVMPRKILTRFVIVKHGFEARRFIIVDADGHSVGYAVIGRGTKAEVVRAMLAPLHYFCSRGDGREAAAQRFKTLGRENFGTFV